MSDGFVGDYNLVTSENFDDFLKALGVGMILRKTAGALKPSFHVAKDGEDAFTFKSVSTFKTTEIKFKLGEEFEQKRMDGVLCKCVITKDGNKFIEEQKSDPPAKIVREFNGDELKIVCTCKDAVATRIYKRATK
ncbi:fatty acid-binding protein [Tetranychus urticae]|uniref:Fatty acid-binding protein n=1 Tax=Tetranychus urticae TaxID=32264 RepID=T1K2Q6_TETUR|nr:fatty acid-binding protein [Tetranychus urticae]